MIDIFYQFKQIFSQKIIKIAENNKIKLDDNDLNKYAIEPTKDKKHGDFACNIAMVLIKNFSASQLNNPRKLAQEIINEINSSKNDNFYLQNIEKIEIAGPGFINIFVNNKIFYKILGDLLKKKSYNFPNLGNNKKINLEYASPNPTGPIHVGHTRGAIYGDVLAKLLTKTGYDVLKEYYINDAGSQITTLVKSSYIRYLQIRGEKIDIPEGFYPGEYLIDIGKELNNKYGSELQEEIGDISEINSDKSQKSLEKIRDFVVDSMVEMIKSDLKDLGIIHDSYFSEKKNLHDNNKIDDAIEKLRQQNLIYQGKLEAPKTEKGVGALPEGYSEEIQTLFRSTKFGDDQDRVVKKSDGSPTYFGADLAYILSKFERGATEFIMPLGFDHAGYVKRLKAAVKALTDDKAKLKIILCQMVKFVKNGQPLKMSKRAGNFITAKEVIDQVGSDALRFIMLTRKNDAPFDFDINKVIEQSKDNPIFYVQYAHARCCSVLRNLSEENILTNLENEEINFDVLNNLKDESEIEIIRKIASFNRIIESSVASYEPHKIAFYLQELAALFHSLWNKGVENPNLKFIIKDDLESTKARIYLVMAVKLIIKNALDIFNIKALETMR